MCDWKVWRAHRSEEYTVCEENDEFMLSRYYQHS
jgi:hypothetical protein